MKKIIAQNNKSQMNEVVLILTNGKDNLEMFFDYDHETIWATQNVIASIFGSTKQNISKHIKNILITKELDEKRTVNKKLTVQKEGEREVDRMIDFYNLDMIIAVGYRINSGVATKFRQWATERISEYLIKGFTMDDERLKKNGYRYFKELIERVRDIRSSERNLYQKVTDIYATSIDYDGKAEDSRLFFKTVQNKMHFAVSQKTAAEIISERADSSKPFMGLSSFKNNYVLQEDTLIAKNYLDEEELQSLNLLVDAYLSFAETQAARRIPMKMKDWKLKLDEYLKFASYEVLDNAGKISHENAVKKAELEFEKYKKISNKNYISDFDREVKKLLENPSEDQSLIVKKKKK